MHPAIGTTSFSGLSVSVATFGIKMKLLTQLIVFSVKWYTQYSVYSVLYKSNFISLYSISYLTKICLGEPEMRKLLALCFFWKQKMFTLTVVSILFIFLIKKL